MQAPDSKPIVYDGKSIKNEISKKSLYNAELDLFRTENLENDDVFKGFEVIV